MAIEKIEELKKKVKENLYIARVPEKTKVYFKNLASLDFEGDYGMTLKFLCDVHKGWLPPEDLQISARFEMVMNEITNLRSEIEQLKQDKKEEKPKSRKMLNGKELKNRRNE